MGEIRMQTLHPFPVPVEHVDPAPPVHGQVHRILQAKAVDPRHRAAVAVEALEAGSIGHGTWPAVGVTAEILLADALGTRVLGTARAYTMSPLAWHAGKPFGAPLDATTGLAAARHAKARYFVLLRMQPGPRGVILNARVADVRSGALRALESMVWTPDLTLPQACDALAKRIRARLQE